MNEKDAEKVKETEKKYRASPTYQWEVVIHHNQAMRHRRLPITMIGPKAAARAPSASPQGLFNPNAIGVLHVFNENKC